MEPKKISDNVTLYSADPIVYVVSNFLSNDECEAFVEMGKGRMERAKVISDDFDLKKNLRLDYSQNINIKSEKKTGYKNKYNVKETIMKYHE